MTDSLTILGLPREMPRPTAEDLRTLLVELWQAAHGRDPGGLRPDLLEHQRYFDPIARGASIRSALASLKPVQLPPGTPVALALPVANDRALITLEGRIAIDLLDRALESTASRSTFDAELAAQRVYELLIVYRDLAGQRLTQTLEYLGGSERPLQLPAIGATLTLLVNRSDAPERAITRFPRTNAADAQDKIDQAFFAAAEAFRAEIPARRRKQTSSRRNQSPKERLISGWTLHEITRRIPDALVIEDERLYVNKAREDDVLDLIVRELGRRKEVDSVVLESAFESLVRVFRATTAPTLAGFGVLFERPGDTNRLRSTLLSRFEAGATV